MDLFCDFIWKKADTDTTNKLEPLSTGFESFLIALGVFPIVLTFSSLPLTKLDEVVAQLMKLCVCVCDSVCVPPMMMSCVARIIGINHIARHVCVARAPANRAVALDCSKLESVDAERECRRASDVGI